MIVPDKELLKYIARQMSFKDVNDMTTAERNCAKRLVEAGYLKLVDARIAKEYQPKE